MAAAANADATTGSAAEDDKDTLNEKDTKQPVDNDTPTSTNDTNNKNKDGETQPSTSSEPNPVLDHGILSINDRKLASSDTIVEIQRYVKSEISRAPHVSILAVMDKSVASIQKSRICDRVGRQA